jgi:hypothetical protein
MTHDVLLGVAIGTAATAAVPIVGYRKPGGRWAFYKILHG